jgi:TPR repeat protein
MVLVLAIIVTGMLFFVPSSPKSTDEEMQATFEYTAGLGLAASLIEDMAKSGNRVAQLELGERYMAGEGLTRDVAQGLRWMKLSSDNGYPRAHRRFAMFYDDILGADADVSVSCVYHLRAAYVGSSDSQYVVGTRARDGIGFTRDRVVAYTWLNVASVTNLSAYRARVELEQGQGMRLTAEELATARARSLELLKEIEANKAKK